MSWNGHRKISALATLALLLLLAVVLLGPMVTADVVDIVTAFAKGNWAWLLPFAVALFGANMTWRGYRLNLETKRARTAAYVHGIGFPFEVYSSADLSTLGKALLGTDFDLSYVSRKPPGRQPEQTDRLLDGNLLLTGRAGIGKTREAIEIVRRMAAHKGEEVTVLVPTEIVDAPFSTPPTLNTRNIVLLINDVHLRYVASSQDEELPSPYRSFHERLAATVDYLNKRFVGSDIRLIFTATTKPDLHEVLKQEAQFWSEHRFREYELWPLEKGALPKYVHSIAQHFRVELTDAAARRICNKSDGSCQGIVTALRKLPTGKELDVEQVRGRSFSCPQNWGEQIFNELTSGYPYRLAIFEAIAILRRLGFAPFGFLVVDLATRIVRRKRWWARKKTAQRTLDRELSAWICVIDGLVVCPNAYLEPMGTREIPRRDVLNTLEASFGEHKQFDLLVPCLDNVVGSLAAAADPQLVVQILQAAVAKAKDFAPLRLALSRAHDLAGNHENAFKELSNALRLDPALTKARVALSWHFTRVGDDEKALAAAEEATHTGQDVPFAWLAFGVLLSKAGRHGEAVKVLENACALEPTRAKAFYSLGIAHSKAGCLDDAIRYCETAALLDPYSSEAWATLGISYDRAGQSEKAIVALEKAFRLDRGALTSAISLAIAYRNAKQRERAQKILADAVGRFAASPVGLSKVSAAFGTLGHHQEAARVARHALTLEPDLEEAFRSLFINLPLTSDPKNRAEAIEIGKALTSKTNDPSDWALLSAAYGQNDQHMQSVESAIAALKLDPKCTQAYQSLAMSLGKAKGREAGLLRAFVLTNVGISEDALREAVASEPKDSNMWRLLTWSFTDKGQCSTAALIASNMLENDSQLHGVIFSVVEELRDPCPVEALHLLARLIAIDGTRCKYWNLRGVLNRDLRILDVACLDHEKALSLDPNYPDAWYALGRTYETMGKRGDACAAYSRALVLKPNYTKALRRKQALGC